MRLDRNSIESQCTGCHACVQSCKLSAIQMEYSEDGFLYPQINSQLCIDCGTCARVCPINEKKNITPILESYSGYAKDTAIVSASSSGGVFYYLARQVLQENGVVFGAAFDPAEKEVRHMSTDQVALDRIMRSKYVQSRIGSAYADVECALKAGRRVLFTGTPCQVRGLRSYLGNRTIADKLETVDFMCHGVPSVTFFKEFLCSLEQRVGARITDVTFREKDKGWRTQVLKVYFANGYVWKRDSLNFYYYYYFLNNYSLRNCCYECKEYNTHTSDLTLADDWISKADKNEKGTSLIFVNTVYGQRMIECIRERLILTKTEMNGLEVYSHEKYEKDRKRQWLEAWKKYGLKYVSGKYYRKVCGREQLFRYLQNCLGCAKKAVKEIIFLRSK